MKKIKYLWSPPNIGPDSTAMMLALSILVFVIIVCAVSAGKAFEIYSMTFDSFPRQTLMDVIGGTFGGFWVHAAVCAALIIRNYRSFYAPSSSVYLMKRIEKTYQMIYARWTSPKLFQAVCQYPGLRCRLLHNLCTPSSRDHT